MDGHPGAAPDAPDARDARRRRRAPVLAYAILGVLSFGLITGMGLVFGRPLGSALRHGALYAVGLLIYQVVLQRVLRRTVEAQRPTGDDERPASWRTYDGDVPAKWRNGWLHRSGSGFVAIPVHGDTGPRVQPADVREVRERDDDRSALRAAYLDPMRVLELTLADGGRLDLLVAVGDVPAVRRWLDRE